MTRSIKDIVLGKNNIEKYRAEMWDSLLIATKVCKGDVNWLSNAILHDDMTVVELIDTLGQNGVRFTVKDM